MNHFSKSKISQSVMRASVAMVAIASAASVFAADPISINPLFAPVDGAPMVDAKQFNDRADGDYIVGFSNLFSANSWAVQVGEEAKWQAEQFPEISKFIITDSEFDANKQINDIQDMITQGADAIVVMPVSPSAVLPILQEAREKGIIVAVVATDVTSEDVDVKILADNVKFGRDGGEVLASLLDDGDKVIALRGTSGIPVDTERFEGAKAALDEKGIEVVSEIFTDWAYEKGRQACEGLLLTHPDVAGVWASGGAPAQGCIEVFHEMGMPLVPITGESNNGFLNTWAENEPNGMVSVAPVYPATFAAEGIKAAMAILNGQGDIASRFIAAGTPIVQDNFKDYYQPDYNDSYWPPSNMDETRLTELYGK